MLCRLFIYTKGVPKPKKEPNPRIDDDVRPVVICDSVIKIVDKIAFENVSTSQRNDAMGPYQLIGKSKSAEIANEAVSRAETMLAMNDDLACSSLDAINAFGSVDRSNLYDLIKQKIPITHGIYFFAMYTGTI